MAKNIEIRNSTAEFLIFMLEGKEDGIQVMYKDETIWSMPYWIWQKEWPSDIFL